VQEILAFLHVFHQTHNLARNKFARALADQPIRALHFFDQQQMFPLQLKLIMQGEKREISTKTCNETMLRDKLMVLISYFAALKGLKSRTMAVHVRFESWNISLASSAKRQREMIKFYVF